MQLLTLDKVPKEVLASIDIQTAFIVSRLIVAAERLQVFRRLHGRRMRSAAIGRALKIHSSYRAPFLNSLVSLGLLHKEGDTYSNTRLAEKYFIDQRPIYWTRQYSKQCVHAYKVLTELEKALASGRRDASAKGRKKPRYVQDRRQAEDFTQMLFHVHQEDAEALAKCLDLSKHRAVLDVGGGSGVMSIALVRKNPGLRACVLDFEMVCDTAAENIQRAGLSQRVAPAPCWSQSGEGGYRTLRRCGPWVRARWIGMAIQGLPGQGTRLPELVPLRKGPAEMRCEVSKHSISRKLMPSPQRVF